MRLFEINNLENIASGYEGNIYDTVGDPPAGKASDYTWKEYENFPLKLFKEMNKHEWINWFENELNDLPERNYEILTKENIMEPVILIYHDNTAYLWDGYHRVGASFYAGKQTIPAIVGRPKL